MPHVPGAPSRAPQRRRQGRRRGDHPRARWPRTRLARRVVRRGRRADRLREAGRASSSSSCAPQGSPRSTTTSSATAMAAAGVDPAGFDSDPASRSIRTCRRPRGLPSGAGQPRRGHRGQPRARSTTSTRSSCTTSASPSGAAARCSGTAGRSFPPTSWRGPQTASARSAPSPARRGTSTCTCSSGTTTSTDLAADDRGARCSRCADQLDADRAAAHQRARRGPPRPTRHGAAASAGRPGSATPARPGDAAVRTPTIRSAHVVRRRIEKAQRRLLEHGRAITPATPAEDVHELRKDAKKLRYLLECFGGLLPTSRARRSSSGSRRCRTTSARHQDAEVHVAQLRQAVDELPAGTAAGDVRGHRPADRAARGRSARAPATSSPSGSPSTTAKATRRALRAVLDGSGG